MMAAAWRGLRRMSTALWLLLAVSVAAAMGTPIPQEPSAGPTVEAWRAGSEGPGVGAASVLDALGLFDLFASPWFLALVALLFASLTACLVLRWRAFAGSLRRPPPPGRRLDRLRNTAVLVTGAHTEAALAAAASVLQKRRFRVLLVPAEHGPRGRAQVAAERGRVREGGSLVFHSSFYVLLLGITVAQAWGFTGQVDLVEGETFAETHVAYHQAEPGRAFGLQDHRGFLVTLEGFAASYHPNGVPSDFAATVTIDGGDGDERTETVRLNHPLRHQGMAIYLARFGMAPWVEVRRPDGALAFAGPVRLVEAGEFAWTGVARVPLDGGEAAALDLVLLPDATLASDGGAVVGDSPEPRSPLLLADLYVGGVVLDGNETGPDRSQGPAGPTAILAPGESAPLGDGTYTVTFARLDDWAGLQVSRQPARGLLLLGALLALGGLVPSLHASHRRVWVEAEPLPDGATSLRVAGVTRHHHDRFAAEFARLTVAIEKNASAP